MLSEVPPLSFPLSNDISNHNAVNSASRQSRGETSSDKEFIPMAADSMRIASDSPGIYQEHVVHNDREILTEYQDDADYVDGAGDRSSRVAGQKYVSPIWNPLAYIKNLDGLGRTIFAYIVVSTIITIALLLHIRYGVPQVPPHAGAVTDVSECSRVAMQILQDGGSAVDAAIASMTCVEVVNFQSTGIGGGGFMLVYDHRARKGKVFDFRETAPAHFKPNTMMPSTAVDETPEKSDVLMIGVPGLLKGFDAAHQQYGRLPWHRLFQPAIDLARYGFNVSATLAYASREKLIGRFLSEPLRRLLYSGKTLVTEGHLLRRENLSYTLERIANMGAQEFYEGHIATKLVEDVAAMGGILTEDDLRNYHVIVREPLIANVSDYTIMTAPPPSSGAALIFGLKVMEKFTKSLEHVAQEHHRALDNADAWQHLIETLKLMFIEQSRLGDVSGTVSTSDAVNRTQADMLSAATIERVFQTINNSKVLSDADAYFKTVGIEHGEKVVPLNDAGTSGGVFVDNDELYVSVITSLNDQFGAGVLSEHLGILLNNQLRDFAPNDDPVVDHTVNNNNNNLARPNKRPLSSMTPTAFFHPTKSCFKRGAFAGSNGTRILSGMFEVLTRILLFDEDLYEAIEAPRAHVAKFPDNKVFLESGIPQSILEELRTRGQNIVALAERKQSTINGLMKWNDTLVGHADSRKHGGDAMYK